MLNSSFFPQPPGFYHILSMSEPNFLMFQSFKLSNFLAINSFFSLINPKLFVYLFSFSSLQPNNPGWDIICVWIESFACLGETCQLSLPTTQSRGNWGSEQNVLLQGCPWLDASHTSGFYSETTSIQIIFLTNLSHGSSSNYSITGQCLGYFLYHNLFWLFVYFYLCIISFLPKYNPLEVGIWSIFFISASPETMTMLDV